MPKSYLLDTEFINHELPTSTRTSQAGGGSATITIEGMLPEQFWQVCRAHINLSNGNRHFTGYTERHTTTIERGNIITKIDLRDSQFHLTHIPLIKKHYKNTVGILIEQLASDADALWLLPVIYQCPKVRIPDPSGLQPFILIDIKLAPLEFDITQENFTFDNFIKLICDTYALNYCIDHATEKLVIYSNNYSLMEITSNQFATDNIKILNLSTLILGCSLPNGDIIESFGFQLEPAKLDGVLIIGLNGDKSPDGSIVNVVNSKTTVFNNGDDNSQISYELISGWQRALTPAKLRWQFANPLISYDFHHYSYTTLLLNTTSTSSVQASGFIRNYPPFVGVLYRFTALLEYAVGFGRFSMLAPPFTKLEENWNIVETMTPTPSNDSVIYNNFINENVIGTVNFTAIRPDQTGLKLIILYRFSRDGNKNVGGLINPANFLSVGEMDINLYLAGILIRTWHFSSSDTVKINQFDPGSTTLEIFDLAELGLNHLIGSQQLKLEFIGDMNFGFEFVKNGPFPTNLFDYYNVVGCEYGLSAFLSGDQEVIDFIVADPTENGGLVPGIFPYRFVGPTRFNGSGPSLFESEP